VKPGLYMLRMLVNAPEKLSYWVTNMQYEESQSPAKVGVRQVTLEAGNGVTQFALLHAYPNPFNPTTRIDYELAGDVHVALVVYDLLGREVATLASGEMRSGAHTAVWDAHNNASGTYFVRLTVTDQLGTVLLNKTEKLVLTK
jgi:hypothetical protein